jgi:hypothetical protein
MRRPGETEHGHDVPAPHVRAESGAGRAAVATAAGNDDAGGAETAVTGPGQEAAAADPR